METIAAVSLSIIGTVFLIQFTMIRTNGSKIKYHEILISNLEKSLRILNIKVKPHIPMYYMNNRTIGDESAV